MIIVRNKTKLIERDFSDIDNFEGDCRSAIEFILKVLLMYGLENGINIEHWIDRASRKLLDSKDDVNISGSNASSVIGFLGLSNKDERKRYLNNLYNELKVKSPEEYVLGIINRLKTVTRGGDVKYAHYLKTLTIDKNLIESLVVQLRYIALCLGGQWNEDINNWFELYSNPFISIDFLTSKLSYSNPDKLSKRLNRILVTIDPGIANYPNKFLN